MAGDKQNTADVMDQERYVERVIEIPVANEFAQVVVSKVNTPNGERIEIESPKMENRIRLDPLELESLTWQDHDTFAEFLRTPFGGSE